jgi:hypothetical protein
MKNTINLGFHTSLKLVTRYGCTCKKSDSRVLHREIKPLLYGPYTILKVVGESSFELNLPPFIGLNFLFNVELCWAYFFPLLDTLEVAKHLDSTELNIDCIDQAIVDQLIYNKLKNTS